MLARKCRKLKGLLLIVLLVGAETEKIYQHMRFDGSPRRMSGKWSGGTSIASHGGGLKLFLSDASFQKQVEFVAKGIAAAATSPNLLAETKCVSEQIERLMASQYWQDRARRVAEQIDVMLADLQSKKHPQIIAMQLRPMMASSALQVRAKHAADEKTDETWASPEHDYKGRLDYGSLVDNLLYSLFDWTTTANVTLPSARPRRLGVLKKLFVNPATPNSGGFIKDDVFGFVQVLSLGCVYGYILLFASNKISSGSELLLLVPSLAGVVGSVVLPVLGAVPDGAIMLFSGLGDKDKVQKELSIGMGVLAGSTVMLLTIPWFLSLMGGRVPVINGKPQYGKAKHGKTSTGNFFTSTGVAPQSSIRVNAVVMVFTGLINYLAMDIPALALGSKSIAPFAWAGSVLCFVFFIGYLVLQFHMARTPSSGPGKLLDAKITDTRVRAIRNGDISLRAALLRAIHQVGETTSVPPWVQEKQLRDTVRPFFAHIDINGDGHLSRSEVKGLLDLLGENSAPTDLDAIFNVADVEGDQRIDFEEFVNWLTGSLHKEPPALVERTSQHRTSSRTSFRSDEEDDEPDMPTDLKHLPPKKQQLRILWRAIHTMGLGALLVLLFSDPMVDVLSTLGERTHIPAFFIAFLLAPLASNASEMIASYNYAMKRTQKSITISFSQLLGAACMNNTFCLLIFNLLIALRGLKWTYHAEVIGIIAVELLVASVALRPVQLVSHGVAVLSLLPLCLATMASLKSTVFTN